MKIGKFFFKLFSFNYSVLRFLVAKESLGHTWLGVLWYIRGSGCENRVKLRVDSDLEGLGILTRDVAVLGWNQGGGTFRGIMIQLLI